MVTVFLSYINPTSAIFCKENEQTLNDSDNRSENEIATKDVTSLGYRIKVVIRGSANLART